MSDHTMLRAAGLIFGNEFRLLSRDRVGLFMLVFAPVAIILVAGLSLGKLYGVNPGPRAYVVPIVDGDHGAVAQGILAALRREPSISVLVAPDVETVRADLLHRRRSPLAIVIPPGTTHALEIGSKAQLILYVDPVRRIEIAAIELRLDELLQEIAAHAQDQARQRLAAQSADLRRELDLMADRVKQIDGAVAAFARQLAQRQADAAAAIDAQLQHTIRELQRQTQAAVEQSMATTQAAFTREMAPRRDAIIAVRNYLIALQAAERDFDRWFAALQAAAGSHRGEIPPPPAFPDPPTPQQLTELSRPFAPPALYAPSIPAVPGVAIKLPDLPPPPRIELPNNLDTLRLTAGSLPGSLAWREDSIAGTIARPNAFDQYVPGFGITFLLIAMLMGVGMGLIDERDWGTLQRLRVSGAPIQSVLAGKLGCRFIVGLLQMILLLAVGRGLFGISLGRAPAMLLLPAAAIAFAAVAFSLVIACVARTHDSVMPIGAVTAMVMSAIGGCWWPLDFEPAWIRGFAQVLPTTWTMEAFNDLMIRQTPPSDVLWPCAVAAMLGGLYLVVSMVAVSRLYE
jgi:ABC-type multidrug transport system permease subunit